MPTPLGPNIILLRRNITSGTNSAPQVENTSKSDIISSLKNLAKKVIQFLYASLRIIIGTLAGVVVGTGAGLLSFFGTLLTTIAIATGYKDIPRNQDEILDLLNKNNIVVTKKDVKNTIKIIDFCQNIKNRLGPYMPQLSNTSMDKIIRIILSTIGIFAGAITIAQMAHNAFNNNFRQIMLLSVFYVFTTGLIGQ